MRLQPYGAPISAALAELGVRTVHRTRHDGVSLSSSILWYRKGKEQYLWRGKNIFYSSDVMEGVTYCILYTVFPRWGICFCYLYNALCVELEIE